MSEGPTAFKSRKNKNFRLRKVPSDEEKNDSDDQTNEEIL